MKSKFRGILTLFVAFMAHITFAQEKTITGVVSDANGPALGVAVIVKGTSTGTQTDFDGNYSIQANVGDVLEFSSLGYATQNLTVGSSNTINVTLQDDVEALGEVVVTALGIKKEAKALGYSVQSINGESMTEARESNITNAISGKVSGVQVTATSGSVGSSSRIVLRGNSSITGNNEPLYVVDGVPISNASFSSAGSFGGVDLPNGAADLNPDDIESVTVLKGPNAAALYGLRAGNGVIVITTKKGSNNNRHSVSYNSNVTFSTPLLLASYQNSYGQGGSPDFFEFVDGASGGVGDGVDESWGPALDVGLEFVQWNSQLNGGKPLPWRSYPNNVRDFLDTGVNIIQSVSFTSSNFRVSVGNSDEKGMIPFTEFKKTFVNTSGNLELGSKFNVGINVNYTNTDSDNLPTTGYDNENPFQQFIWSARNVNFSELRDWRNFPLAPEGTAAAGTPLNWNHNFQNNPYWVLETNRNTHNKDRLVGNVNLNYKITDWLTASSQIGLDFFSQLNTTRKAHGSNNAPNGFYSEVQRRFEEVNAQGLLDFNKDLTEDFNLSLSLGVNHMNRKFNNIRGTLPQLELPDLYNLSNIRNGSTATISNLISNQQINSVFFTGQLSYKNFAFIGFTGRNDWASVLPVKNNSFFYPSVNASLVISDMIELESKYLSYLKLRGGWSKVGSNGALGPYNLTETFNLSNTGFGNQGSVPNTQWNPNLSSESVTGIEFGLEGRLFSSRVKFEATYYDQLSEDLLVPIQVSAGTGFSSQWNNIARMRNKGIELSLGLAVIKNEDFSFDVDLNWAKNENEVESLGELDSYVLGGQWGASLEARPGHPYGVIVGRDFERTTNGEVIYENGIPQLSNTNQILGDIAPDWTGGANFSFRYKNIDASFLVDAKIGGEIHSMTYSWGRFAGTLEETLEGRETGIIGEGVRSDGAGGFVPNDVVVSAKVFNQSAFNNSVESSSVFDASYVKLRQVSFGYSIPSKFLNKLPINQFKISVVGRNLALLHKNVPHIDPESAFSSSNGNQGQEFGQLPSARNIGFNVNIKF